MVKKLQALRAKKGFTLVELIVVIAIIGVLAAILVPTMMGMVTKSRVTSANSTAKGISDCVGQFLTDADTAGKGMMRGKANAAFLFTVGEKGAWNCYLVVGEAGKTFKKETDEWVMKTQGLGAETESVKGTQLEKLTITLADRFPTMKEAAAVVYVNAGTPVFCIYSADVGNTTALADFVKVANVPGVCTDSNGKYAAPSVCEWDKKTAGIAAGDQGFICGTMPEVGLGDPATNNVSATMTIPTFTSPAYTDGTPAEKCGS